MYRYICRLVEVLSSLITKRLGPQVADPQSATLTESPQIYKFADFLFSVLICGPPPLETRHESERYKIEKARNFIGE
jgi:hypothetical protein